MSKDQIITTEAAMFSAGETSRQSSWDDGELIGLIDASRLTLAYLRGRGAAWWLAVAALSRELEIMEQIANSRGLELSR